MKKQFIKSGVLSSSYALTSSYATVGDSVNAKGYDQLSLLFEYSMGDETSFEFKVQFSDTSDFSDVYERAVVSTDGSGVSDVLDNSFKRSTTGNFEIPISVRGFYVRIQAKASDGTPTGTIGLKYRLENIER